MAGGDAAGTDPSCFMSHMSAGLPHGSINQEILHQQLNSIPPSKFSCYKQRQQEHRLTHLRQKRETLCGWLWKRKNRSNWGKLKMWAVLLLNGWINRAVRMFDQIVITSIMILKINTMTYFLQVSIHADNIDFDYFKIFVFFLTEQNKSNPNMNIIK